MNEYITIEQLIKKLESIVKEREDRKHYGVRVIEDTEPQEEGFPKPNYWLTNIDVSDEGESGHELHGEIRLTGSE